VLLALGRSTRLRASSVRWRRCGGSKREERAVLGQGVQERQQRGIVSWRAGSSVNTCPVTLARMVRVSSRSSTCCTA